MASDNSTNERADGRRLRVNDGKARRIFSTGNCTPMTPVEQTKTSCGWTRRRRAVSSIVRRETASPCAPVAQLAFPAFTTTARMRPLESCRCFFDRVTGAATTRFCVNTAAAEARTSLEKIAKSSAPVFFRPQAVAAKRNPCGSAASEGAWFIRGVSGRLALRSRKGPPILRNGGEGSYLTCGLQTHGLAPVLLAFLLRRASKSSIAARTLSGAVPPGTFFAESAASTLRLFAKSASNAGEICLSFSWGRVVN